METMWRGRPRAATMLPGADAIPISFCPNMPGLRVKGLGGFRVSAMPMSFYPNISVPLPGPSVSTWPEGIARSRQIARSRADCPTDRRGATSVANTGRACRCGAVFGRATRCKVCRR